MLTVFGTLYTDISMFVDCLPGDGAGNGPGDEDIVTGRDHVMAPGGKGANQALAAARAAAKVAFIAMVGDDDNGKRATTRLRRAGVKISGVGVADGQATGIAVVMRRADGTRETIICPGANEKLASDQVPSEILNSNAYVLAQMDTPRDEMLALLHKAKGNGATTLVNSAPGADLSPLMFEHIDYLILSHNSARQLCRQSVWADHENDVARIAYNIAAASDSVCIVTCSADGSVAMRPNGTGWHVEAIAMTADRVVDDTGSGDAYAGTLAACLKNGMQLDKGMLYASAAGSLTCRYVGAQEALPYWAEIETACSTLAAPVAIRIDTFSLSKGK